MNEWIQAAALAVYILAMSTGVGFIVYGALTLFARYPKSFAAMLAVFIILTVIIRIYGQ